MEGKSSVRVGEYSAYVFDLDGTLFTIPVDWAGVRKELSSLIGAPMEDAPLFKKISDAVSSNQGLRQRIFGVLDSHELRVSESARPMPGAEELLYSLFEVAKLALVTMQGRATAEDILRRHKVLDLFEVVITREDSLDRADQLRIALNRLGAESASTLFTGDRLNDVVCGKRAGVDVALVGRAQAEPKPDYSFPSLVELKAYLE